MINVGIAGSFSSISRHVNALSVVPDIRITGCWELNNSQESVKNSLTGFEDSDPETVIEKNDALIIADSGSFTNRLTVSALRKGKHVYLYPSAVRSVDDAYQLVKLAREANVILKCGKTGHHDISALADCLKDHDQVNMIEFHHSCKVEDSLPGKMMPDAIQEDMEVINQIVHAQLVYVKAKGLSVLTDDPDIVHAWFEFDNGCTASYNCNLVSAQHEHWVTIVLNRVTLRYNMGTNEITKWCLLPDGSHTGNPISVENIRSGQTNPLLSDLSNFFHYIRSEHAFLSVSENGLEPYVMTQKILDKVMKQIIQYA